jgi:hypothetical protein
VHVKSHHGGAKESLASNDFTVLRFKDVCSLVANKWNGSGEFHSWLHLKQSPNYSGVG